MSGSTPGRLSQARHTFRNWRRSRPFWGGVTAIIAGIELYALTMVPFSLMLIQGVAGISALLIMVLFVLLAVVTWFQPHLRTVTGLVIVVLALASIVLTNLGGLLVGMLLGLHSGASIAAWKPTASDPGGTGTDPGTGTGTDPGTDTAATDPAGEPPRRRWGNRAQGLGVALAVLCLALAPLPRASAATTAPVPAAPGSLFCQIFPWLCPPPPAPSPAPSPAPTPAPTSGSTSGPGQSASPAPGPAPTAGPASPTSPGASAVPTAGTGPAASCDRTQVPARADLGSSAARTAASVLQACLAAQKAGTLKVSTATTGSGPTVVSTVPAHLLAAKETMNGLAYDGVVTVQTAAGPQRALKFRADSVTIEGIRQDVAQPGATTTLTGSQNVTLSGSVQLYVLSQRGNAFGLIPLTLSPSSPPPLVIPFMVFTDVDSQIAYEQAGTLSFPGARITVT